MKSNRVMNGSGFKSGRWIGLTLFVLAVILYLPGMWWGLPHATAPDRIYAWGSDEIAPLGPIAELYSVFVAPNPSFNPQYPLFHYIMQALLVGPYVLWLLVTGDLAHPSVKYPYGLSDPVSALAMMTLLARRPMTGLPMDIPMIFQSRIREISGGLLWDTANSTSRRMVVMMASLMMTSPEPTFQAESPGSPA